MDTFSCKIVPESGGSTSENIPDKSGEGTRGGEMTQRTTNQNDQRKTEFINTKRNPYLVDYEEQLMIRRTVEQNRRPKSQKRIASVADQRARRKKIVRRQRLAVALWVLCIFILVMNLFIKNTKASAAEQENRPARAESAGETLAQPGAVMIQGLPYTVYAEHPQWKEDFLTPNEYSRPGEALEQVTSIFVHYTANQGTSAAQNRSYFEQQKDLHERSVSAHFIIGYEGEIIQCVPLDEIAYAVMTRNSDSISIECCYLAEDGSFTQKTYDSLIGLLAWLVDAYNLDTDDILRHYDCGGKKCPLYYTENPEEWEQLKQDVNSQINK